jgi:hypothetical protein
MTTAAPLSWYRRFPERFQGSRRVQRMSFAEQGLYNALLDEEWIKGAIPDTPEAIADLLATAVEEVLPLWPKVKACFVPAPDMPGYLINPVLEEQRSEAQAFQAQRSAAGKASAEARRKKQEMNERSEEAATLVEENERSLNERCEKPNQYRTVQNNTKEPPMVPQGDADGRKPRKPRAMDVSLSPENEQALEYIRSIWPKTDGEGKPVHIGAPGEIRRRWKVLLESGKANTRELRGACLIYATATKRNDNWITEDNPEGYRYPEAVRAWPPLGRGAVMQLETFLGPQKAPWLLFIPMAKAEIARITALTAPRLIPEAADG